MLFRQVLEEMEMLSAFTAILHVPNLCHADEVVAVLEESDVFSKQELATIARKIDRRRYDAVLLLLQCLPAQ